MTAHLEPSVKRTTSGDDGEEEEEESVGNNDDCDRGAVLPHRRLGPRHALN